MQPINPPSDLGGQSDEDEFQNPPVAVTAAKMYSTKRKKRVGEVRVREGCNPPAKLKTIPKCKRPLKAPGKGREGRLHPEKAIGKCPDTFKAAITLRKEKLARLARERREQGGQQ